MRNLICLLLFLIIHSCKIKQAIVYSQNDLLWKKEVMLNLSGRFVDYIKIRPRDSIHNYEQDMYNKFIDLDRYPFGDGFVKVQSVIEKSKINFDSIVCTTMQYGMSFNPEYLYPNTYYVFKNGKIIKEFEHNAENLELKEIESGNKLNNFNTIYNKKDNNSSSLLVFTTIYSDWKFKVSKTIINPYLFE